MSDWTVDLSTQFRDDLTAIQEAFAQRLKQIKTNKAAEVEWRKCEDFQVFASDALDLRDGLADPAKLLKPYKGNPGQTGTYVLDSPSGHWEGSFSVDEEKKVYYGIKVYEKPK